MFEFNTGIFEIFRPLYKRRLIVLFHEIKEEILFLFANILLQKRCLGKQEAS